VVIILLISFGFILIISVISYYIVSVIYQPFKVALLSEQPGPPLLDFQAIEIHDLLSSI